MSSLPQDSVERVATQALELLEPPLTDGDVHELRKHGKRIRAWVRQVEPALGRRRSRRAVRAFRDAARCLSSLRDARVMADTLAAVGIDDPPPMPSEVDREVARIEAQLLWREGCAAIADLPWHEVGLSDLMSGVARTYATGRGRWRHLATERYPTAEALHELRKAVKALGYQLDLVVDAWPPVLGPLRAEVDALQEALGGHHDVHVLREVLHERGTEEPAELAARESALLARVRELAPPLFAPPPKTWRRFVGAVVSGAAAAGR